MRIKVGACDRSALLLLAAIACSDDGTSDPSPRIDELFLSVSTAEAEQGRRLMVVGEVGSAHAIAFRNSLGTDPGQVAFTATTPAVVAVQPTGTVDARLTAAAPGSVQIVATAQGLSDQIRVDVVETPLPVDPIQVRLAPISSDVAATFDTQGGLLGVTLAPGGSAALELRVSRDGIAVTQIPFVLASSQPSLVRVDQHCRPPELDPNCDVFGTWGWITGFQAGQSEITVTVRDEAASFLVTVE